jgi:hypothetical protein
MNKVAKGDTPAFPTPSGAGAHWTGMSIRDWFAGQALGGICTPLMSVEPETLDASKIASLALAIGDAMVDECDKEWEE